MKKKDKSGVLAVSPSNSLRCILPSILIGLVCFFILWETQFSFPHFYSRDSYYHTRYTQTLLQRGITSNFPWTQFSIWRERFSDKDFLFHLYLLPFCFQEANLVQRGKMAALILACMIFAVFFRIAYRNRLVSPYIWLFLLLIASSKFQLRLLCVRPQFLGVLFALLFVDSFINNRGKSLFLYSLLWPLAHSSFPLIPVLGGIILLSGFDRRKGVRLLVYSAAGLGVGLVINPYFPNNLYFFWVQGIQVLRNSLGVKSEMPRIFGQELTPFPLGELLAFSSTGVVVFSVGVIGAVCMRLSGQKLEGKVSNFLLVSMFFFICTFFWQRFIEFWLPFAFLFFGSWFSQLLETKRVQRLYQKKKLMVSAMGMILLIMVGLLLVQRQEMRFRLKQLEKISSPDILPIFQSGATWMRRNIAPGQTIFHPIWDIFPQLYFYDQDHYYIIGLDPAFFYYYDKDLFDLWYRISLGEVPNIYESVHNRFGSKVIFFPKINELSKLYLQIVKDKRISRSYEDPYCIIFQLMD